MICGFIPEANEEAVCLGHAVEIAGITRPTLYYRVKPELWDGVGAVRMACDLRWRGRCLIPMGVLLDQLHSDEGGE